MAYDEGLRVAAVQHLEERTEGCLLLGCAGVGGLTADVEPALVADAYRVGIVVQAVGTNFPLFSQYIMVLSISVGSCPDKQCHLLFLLFIYLTKVLVTVSKIEKSLGTSKLFPDLFLK
jgi:hypothetical protein